MWDYLCRRFNYGVNGQQYKNLILENEKQNDSTKKKIWFGTKHARVVEAGVDF